MTREEFSIKVRLERDRQDKKWGKQQHPDFFWLTILVEEIGEVAKSLLEENETESELIQVAAICEAWMTQNDN